MFLKTKVYPQKEFESIMQNRDIDDSTVWNLKDEYFIGINSTGWIHSIPYFKEQHSNVITLYFDDIEKDKWKTVPYPGVGSKTIYAIACTEAQARQLKTFIDSVPKGSLVHIYCAQGKSRSVGISAYINHRFNGIQPVDFNFNTYLYNLLMHICP